MKVKPSDIKVFLNEIHVAFPNYSNIAITFKSDLDSIDKVCFDITMPQTSALAEIIEAKDEFHRKIREKIDQDIRMMFELNIKVG